MKLFTAGLLIVLAAGPAYPQKKEILQLQSDMISLKSTIDQLQTSVDKNNAAMKGLVEKIADQVNTLATGMQNVNRAVDSIKAQDDKSVNELRTILTNLDKHMNEVQESVASVQRQVNSVSGQITSMKTTSEPLARPEDLIRTAASDASAGNYDLAIGGFQDFLSKYPTHPRAADVQLSIAEVLFSQKKYDQALNDYDIFLQKYPGHDKTSAALYKKGLSLAELNQTPKAIETLNQVVKDFPGTSEAANAQTKVRELQPARRSR